MTISPIPRFPAPTPVGILKETWDRKHKKTQKYPEHELLTLQ